MPLLQVKTNQVLDRETGASLLPRCSQAVAGALGKPERYVMVSVEGGVPMLFAGDDSPCAYLELKSIGLPENKTAELSETLCTLVSEALGIASERIYIEFADAQRHMWGWNGGTF